MLPNLQVGFIGGICLPCYELLAQVLPNTSQMQDLCKSNLETWKERAEERRKELTAQHEKQKEEEEEEDVPPDEDDSQAKEAEEKMDESDKDENQESKEELIENVIA